eukprot:scaffold5688_cov104-Cylindrotheca_fusiformis.AAC.12
MSDLLPLVVATLKEKTAIDAQAEIAQLRRQVEQFFAVEIIRRQDEDADWYGREDDKIIVYAAGSYDKGGPGSNPNLWTVNLQPVTTCKLEELGNCNLCAGGGFTIVSFGDVDHQGWLNDEDDGTEDKIVNFCFNPTTWLTISIKGWPRRNWEHLMHEAPVDPDATLEYLVGDVARAFPNATVEFRSVSFVSASVHAVFKRMLPPARRAEVRRMYPPGSRAQFENEMDAMAMEEDD